MDFSHLTAFDCTLEDGLVRIVLKRPEAGNVFGTAFCHELNEIACEISTRADVRAVLLSSRGRFFSVGGDIGLMSADQAAVPKIVKSLTSPLHMALARLMQMNAPLVCAVNGGGAFGGAVALVAMADVVVTSSTAKFGGAFCGIGYSCDSGTSVALAQRMGVARAKRFLLLNEMLTATEALAAGLADKVVDEAEVQDAALALAKQLAAGPTLAFGEVKRLFLATSSRPPVAQMEEEAQALTRVAGSADAWEGLSAFVAKRKPVFTGR